MALGAENPLPFRVGGALTPTQRVYAAMVSAVGKGNRGPAGGLRELWRLCLARAIAQAADAKDLAALQAFPATMTVHLPAWERTLLLQPGPTEVARRRTIGQVLTREPDASGPSLAEQLRDIDPNFSLDPVAWSWASTMVPGRAFGPLPGSGGPVFGAGQAAGVESAIGANFSDAYVVHVLYALPAGQTEIPVESAERAAALLNELLPFFCDFTIYNLSAGPDGDGFYLDGGILGDSLLDQTGL